MNDSTLRTELPEQRLYEELSKPHNTPGNPAMTRRINITLSLSCVAALLMPLVGCTIPDYHMRYDYYAKRLDRHVEPYWFIWINKPFNTLLELHPTVGQTTPLSAGHYKYTYQYDDSTAYTFYRGSVTESTVEEDVRQMIICSVLTDIEPYYKIHVWVDEKGIVYKITWERRDL